MKKQIQNIKEKIDRFGIVKLLLILIFIFTVFQAGIFVGYYKARFYISRENNYTSFDRNGTDRQRGGMMGGRYGFGNMMQDSNISGGHGAVGKIVSINFPNIVVASPDNVEKTINISSDTLIRQFRDTLQIQDLKVGEYVIVLGEASASDDGIINARLIRLIPSPEIGTAGTGTNLQNPATNTPSVTRTATSSKTK